MNYSLSFIIVFHSSTVSSQVNDDRADTLL